ncbi:glycosyltransferase [Rhizobium sp. CNPSo 4039]|uniref:glycosyltransferase n=1 Tax=Rhizobium sp. CNPSo 4039 TaxID=3021409 RepID=UPI0025509789|nr:glycosyltransferase [Rhizobium sp. CNPSo 4039]MDK4713671.1 glycosyltransferase [Rhizobium sp. CNPSo 4039]
MDQKYIQNNTIENVLTRQIGHDILGPIVQRWLLGLHQYFSYYDDGNTNFLFCARAGVRIEKLYRLFVEGFGGRDVPAQMFWLSRLSTCKGTFYKAKQSRTIIAREYQHVPIAELIKGIFRHQPEVLGRLDLTLPEYKAHGAVFDGWIQGPTPAASEMRKYFTQCQSDFDAYLKQLLKGRTRAVLVDSGWQGSMQSLLTKAFPDFVWRGLYFGRSLQPGHDAQIVNNVLGVMFEGETYQQSVPETAFTRHRHIVESLLEPNGPSIEEIPGGAHDDVAQRLIKLNEQEKVSKGSDALYLAVIEYLAGEGKNAGIADIYSRHQTAMVELARMIITPTREEARALSCKDRSADFGKKLVVPVLSEPDADEAPENRIKRSLWQEGQAALEFEGGFARDLQLRLAGCANAASYFDPSHRPSAPGNGEASVAIITRTKNRPLLLQRAAQSVAQQTHTNYTWVVVNDGGDEVVARKVIESCAVDRTKILLVSHKESIGMEAASNSGIRNSDSDLIVIHDDDDSWEPTFLEKTVDFLNSSAGRHYGGVVTHTTYVSEEIRGSKVIEHSRQPYKDWVRNVQLAEMAAGNIFAPIAFVFKRSIWEDLGGYNEELPVLGDWFFNLEFLLRADIGLIPTPLANYHHRDRGDSSAYANSVIGGVSKHEEYAAIARNAFIRKNSEKFPGAVAVILGYFAQDFRSRGTSEKINPQQTASGYDFADKYWAVLHLNKSLRKKKYQFHLREKEIDLSIGWPELEQLARKTRGFIPVPPSFDEQEYLRQNEDVIVAVREGRFSSGYSHYILHGRGEGRSRPSL